MFIQQWVSKAGAVALGGMLGGSAAGPLTSNDSTTRDSTTRDSTASDSATRDSSADFTLTVRLSGARNDKGRLAVALFASEADFPRQERAFRAQLLPINKGQAVFTFRGLEPGVYAVAVLHDENSNSKMDFNFLGMPLEGYGFSNDAAVTFGPPSFQAAAFKLVAQHSRSSIQLRYFLR